MTASERQIAIVGVACRYPDATGPAQLWDTVMGQRRAFRSIPSGRVDPRHRDGAPDSADSTYVRRAGLLRDWEFDRAAFRISGSTHRAADHTHWLALETAAHALRDAGFPDGAGLDHDRAGVILGNSLTGEFSRAGLLRLHWPFLERTFATALRTEEVGEHDAARILEQAWQGIAAAFPEPGDETLAGGLSNTIAGRICNYYDFHGTGYTVDGACSSGLLAVITAANAILAGDLTFALAGGVDLSLDPFELIGFARLGALAETHMRVYDRQPTGFLPGEGCGILALMRLDEAERRNLRIYARLLGWGTSSDGSGGLTRPEATGQALALNRAYAAARVEPGDVTMIEGHGTGTAVGDRVELETLLHLRRRSTQAAALGSIKANIGHTKAAAGAASLIKVALAAFHRTLPPTTGCETPHPLLDGARSLEILDEPRLWDAEVPTAGVSAMGFGGINTHIVVAGTHRSRRRPAPAGGRDRATRPGPAGSRPEILLIEARHPDELTRHLSELVDWAGQLSDAEIGDLAADLAERATGLAVLRCAMVAADATELVAAARAALALIPTWDCRPVIDEASGVVLAAGGPARIGLLFPGQAAPVRDATGALDRLVSGVPDLPETLGAITADAGTAVAQPAVIRQSLAGLAWLDALGCDATGAVGHSVGELAALAWAGALSPQAALDLAVARGRIMAEHGVGGTGMVSVSLDAEAAQLLAQRHGLTVAAHNTPETTVLAGPDAALARLAAHSGADGVDAIRLPVSHAFHSPAMQPAVRPWRAELAAAGVTRDAAWPVVSTVTGRPLSSADDLAVLLERQLVAPVLFVPAVRTLAERSDLLLEVGPGMMLTRLASRFTAVPVVSLDCGGSVRSLATATAAVVAAGAGSLAPWLAGRPRRRLRLGASLTFLQSPCGSGISAAGATGAGPSAARRGPAPAAGAPAIAGSVSGSTSTSADVAPPSPPPAVDPAGSADPAGSTLDDAPGSSDPLWSVREHLADVLELPFAGITKEQRLLSDLHLNSLQVARAVSAVAAGLGRRPPVAPLTMVDATVGEAAEAIAALPAASADEPEPVAGVAPWVRAFRHDWAPAPVGEAEPVRWRVAGPAGHPLHRALPAAPAGPDGVAVAITADFSVTDVAALLSRLAAERPARLAVVHSAHPAAAGIGRSVATELAPCAVTVIDVPPEDDLPGLAGHVARTGYTELRRLPDGTTERLTTSVFRPDGPDNAAEPDPTVEPLLRAGDICVVTGGATGITAFAAAALAERTGCRLLILGRRAADAPDVAEQLSRLGAGSGDDRIRYRSVDLTDTAAVRATVDEARQTGPLRAILHGAGVNEPAAMADVTAAGLAGHLGAKADGLRHLLDAVGEQARLVVAFGSIIGRQGLAGQAAYCVANEWLRHDVERWAAAHPEVRAHVLEWSVWSGLGMGVRLAVLDTLRRQGVAPISPADGVDLMWRLLGDRKTPVTVLCAAAFPETATLTVAAPADRPAAERLRFAERVIGRVGGVETVTEADLSAGVDRYLADHRLSGEPLLPAVVGVEAMAQVAALTAGPRSDWTFTDLRFTAPVAVPDQQRRTVRIAALADDGGPGLRLVVRDDTDGFATDRFSAVLAPTESAPGDAGVPDVVTARDAGEPHPWYSSVFFHTGRMRRVREFGPLSAFAVRALVGADDAQGWFGQFAGPDLMLGSPAVHDATLHALLACAPHRRVVPVGADRWSIWQRPDGDVVVQARERAHDRDDYVFDVLVTHLGAPVARWHGLRLRAVGVNDQFENARTAGDLPVELIGPWLSRRLIETGTAEAVELVVGRGTRKEGAARLLVARHLGVPPEDVRHDVAGRLITTDRHLSASYAGDRVMVAAAAQPVGVDWQVLGRSDGIDGADVLGPAGPAAMESLRRCTGEGAGLAAGRLWTLREALLKAGADPDAPLSHIAYARDGVLVSAGAETAALSVVVPHGDDSVLAAAVAVRKR